MTISPSANIPGFKHDGNAGSIATRWGPGVDEYKSHLE